MHLGALASDKIRASCLHRHNATVEYPAASITTVPTAPLSVFQDLLIINHEHE